MIIAFVGHVRTQWLPFMQSFVFIITANYGYVLLSFFLSVPRYTYIHAYITL